MYGVVLHCLGPALKRTDDDDDDGGGGGGGGDEEKVGDG